MFNCVLINHTINRSLFPGHSVFAQGVNEIDRLLDLADANGDGDLEYDEFMERIMVRIDICNCWGRSYCAEHCASTDCGQSSSGM